MSMKLGLKISFLIVILTPLGCDQKVMQNAAMMTGGNPVRGKTAIRQLGCSSCHTIPGVHSADALVGPSLDKIASRVYIGGVLKNTPENMVRWIEDPPGVDPLTAMPNLRVSSAQAHDIASYLYTLK
jgi:cytochrome c